MTYQEKLEICLHNKFICKACGSDDFSSNSIGFFGCNTCGILYHGQVVWNKYKKPLHSKDEYKQPLKSNEAKE